MPPISKTIQEQLHVTSRSATMADQLSLIIRPLETATNSRANAAGLIRRRKELLGVRGLEAKASARSHIEGVTH